MRLTRTSLSRSRQRTEPWSSYTAPSVACSTHEEQRARTRATDPVRCSTRVIVRIRKQRTSRSFTNTSQHVPRLACLLHCFENDCRRLSIIVNSNHRSRAFGTFFQKASAVSFFYTFFSSRETVSRVWAPFFVWRCHEMRLLEVVVCRAMSSGMFPTGVKPPTRKQVRDTAQHLGFSIG